MSDQPVSDSPMYCSFCRRDHLCVDKLVSGPGVFICDRCVGLAGRAMAGKEIPDFAGWDSLDGDELLGSLVAAVDAVRRAHEAVGEVVGASRRRGMSWQRIGDALGVTRQAAWERFAAYG